jgi:hypothetical protein
MTTSTLEFFKCVFPDGLKPEDYFPLLRVLHEEMSFRAVASAVGAFLGKDYMWLLSDVYAAASTSYKSNLERENRIRAQLITCGWLAWLDSPPD